MKTKIILLIFLLGVFLIPIASADTCTQNDIRCSSKELQICESDAWETLRVCEHDCEDQKCTTGQGGTGPRCGDGVCEDSEITETCPQDCPAEMDNEVLSGIIMIAFGIVGAVLVISGIALFVIIMGKEKEIKKD
ncbi:MAG: hypothetical protein ISS36_01110 [Candidatus Aenigmarchaeota archaeon]|nr:hypothetical protein [Candidatus Aenigmarchaeota archaeon]